MQLQIKNEKHSIQIIITQEIGNKKTCNEWGAVFLFMIYVSG